MPNAYLIDVSGQKQDPKIFQRKKTGHIQKIENWNEFRPFNSNTKPNTDNGAAPSEAKRSENLHAYMNNHVSEEGQDVSRYAKSLEFASQVPFPWKLLEDMPHQNDGVKREDTRARK